MAPATNRISLRPVAWLLTVLAVWLPAAAQAETLRWTGTCAGYRLAWTDDDIRVTRDSAPSVPILSCKRDLLALTADEPKATLDATLEPVSWVGPLLTVKVTCYINVPFTAHPSMQTYYRTVDLRKPGQAASLTPWVPEPAWLGVLVADPLVARALKDLGGKPPTSVAALGDRLSRWSGDCEYGFTTDFANRFAFYDLQGDRMVMRIGLSHGCEAARGLFTLLGIELPVPPSLKADLQAAASGKAGFLAVNRPSRKRIEPARVQLAPPTAP